jgi:hypothetical protein
MGINTVELDHPSRAVPEILLKVVGRMVGKDPPMPAVPKGCENSLTAAVKQTWAEQGTLTTEAGIDRGSSKFTNQEGYFLYDNTSSQAFISIFPPKKYCVVRLEVDLSIRIWQNNMEACGASKANQESFISQTLSMFSSCYEFKNGICQCWPAYINPQFEFQLCTERSSIVDPLRFCMKVEKDKPAKCELCITGTKLYKGSEAKEPSGKSYP